MPYNIPNIVFWNLRQTNGFPNTSTKKNTIMISGNSPMLLNEFANKGIECLKEIKPIISKKFTLMNAKDAHFLLETRNVNGKILLINER